MNIKKIFSILLIMGMMVSLVPSAVIAATVPDEMEESVVISEEVAGETSSEATEGVAEIAPEEIAAVQPFDEGSAGIALDASNFPDEAFRNTIKAYLDMDNDGFLNDAEQAYINSGAVTLPVPEEARNIVGIELLPKIGTIEIWDNIYLTTLDLSRNTGLKHLTVYGCTNITTVEVSHCSVLEDVYIEGSPALHTLDLRNNINLFRVICVKSALNTLLLPATTLAAVVCQDNQLQSLDLSETSVEVLYCERNEISSLDLSKSPSLADLRAGNNQLTSLDLSNKPNLHTINVNNNPLISLNIEGSNGIKSLYANETGLAKLDLEGDTELETLQYSCAYPVTVNAKYVNGVPAVDMKNLVGSGSVSKVSFLPASLLEIGASYDEATGLLSLINTPATQSIVYSYDTHAVNLAPPMEVNLIINIPDEPIEEPDEPIEVPDNPIEVPDEPVEVPDNPIDEPREPIEEPDEPVIEPKYPLEGVNGFISRLYLAAFNREPDAAGLAYWKNAVEQGNETATSLTSFFFFSEEYNSKGYSNEATVNRLYMALLNRNSDAEGKAFWVDNLDNGLSITGLIANFVITPEFASICASYDIAVGSIGVTEARDKSPNLTKFLSRLYIKVLGRTAEPSGLNHWAEQMLSGKMDAESVAKQFVFSKEYLLQDHSDNEYLQMLYRAFMGREPEPVGFVYWQEQLLAGISREQVFQRFASSEEFKQIQKEFGIA